MPLAYKGGNSSEWDFKVKSQPERLDTNQHGFGLQAEDGLKLSLKRLTWVILLSSRGSRNLLFQAAQASGLDSGSLLSTRLNSLPWCHDVIQPQVKTNKKLVTESKHQVVPVDLF